MNNTKLTESIIEPHEPHWVSRSAFQIVNLLFFFTEITLAVVLQRGGPVWLVLLLVLIVSHFMHGLLIGFHEATHGMLRRNRRFNEFDGIFIGMFSLMSFSLYRAAHQTHHAHLGGERDEELWPFVHTETPRWGRILAAFLELNAGLIFTPSLFLRTFFRVGSPIRSKKVRRRIWTELALTVAVWISILVAVAYWHVWIYFIWMYLVPAGIAANLQSWRKYIEHVGLTGSTVNSATRNIVSESLLGRIVAFTLLHEPYHGVHHLRAGLTHAELPLFAAELQPGSPEERSPFPSYRSALLDLFRCLADPRVGAQWQNAKQFNLSERTRAIQS
jgi:fatty acid desaturase